jgi:mannose-6-phosphate isomerase-like protein (cupin superfamily)
MKVVKLNEALKSLKKINDEIRYANFFDEKHFTAGVIVFGSMKSSDRKSIIHDDRDVVCHVLQGSGTLECNGKRIRLAPGIICHISKQTPHDFAAARNGELILFYSLIKS